MFVSSSSRVCEILATLLVVLLVLSLWLLLLGAISSIACYGLVVVFVVEWFSIILIRDS